MTMSRAEYLAWAKERALEYADRGDTGLTLASLASDFGKHPELADHDAIMLGTMLAMNGHLDTPQQLRHWVEGFN